MAISWSGGKDGWLAPLRARAAGGDVRYALTMFDESGERSRSHAMAPDLMARQARGPAIISRRLQSAVETEAV